MSIKLKTGAALSIIILLLPLIQPITAIDRNGEKESQLTLQDFLDYMKIVKEVEPQFFPTYGGGHVITSDNIDIYLIVELVPVRGPYIGAGIYDPEKRKSIVAEIYSNGGKYESRLEEIYLKTSLTGIGVIKILEGLMSLVSEKELEYAKESYYGPTSFLLPYDTIGYKMKLYVWVRSKSIIEYAVKNVYRTIAGYGKGIKEILTNGAIYNKIISMINKIETSIINEIDTKTRKIAEEITNNFPDYSLPPEEKEDTTIFKGFNWEKVKKLIDKNLPQLSKYNNIILIDPGEERYINECKNSYPNDASEAHKEAVCRREYFVFREILNSIKTEYQSIENDIIRIYKNAIMNAIGKWESDNLNKELDTVINELDTLKGMVNTADEQKKGEIINLIKRLRDKLDSYRRKAEAMVENITNGEIVSDIAATTGDAIVGANPAYAVADGVWQGMQNVIDKVYVDALVVGGMKTTARKSGDAFEIIDRDFIKSDDVISIVHDTPLLAKAVGFLKGFAKGIAKIIPGVGVTVGELTFLPPLIFELEYPGVNIVKERNKICTPNPFIPESIQQCIIASSILTEEETIYYYYYHAPPSTGIHTMKLAIMPRPLLTQLVNGLFDAVKNNILVKGMKEINPNLEQIVINDLEAEKTSLKEALNIGEENEVNDQDENIFDKCGTEAVCVDVAYFVASAFSAPSKIHTTYIKLDEKEFTIQMRPYYDLWSIFKDDKKLENIDKGVDIWFDQLINKIRTALLIPAIVAINSVVSSLVGDGEKLDLSNEDFADTIKNGEIKNSRIISKVKNFFKKSNIKRILVDAIIKVVLTKILQYVASMFLNKITIASTSVGAEIVKAEIKGFVTRLRDIGYSDEVIIRLVMATYRVTARVPDDYLIIYLPEVDTFSEPLKDGVFNVSIPRETLYRITPSYYMIGTQTYYTSLVNGFRDNNFVMLVPNSEALPVIAIAQLRTVVSSLKQDGKVTLEVLPLEDVEIPAIVEAGVKLLADGKVVGEEYVELGEGVSFSLPSDYRVLAVEVKPYIEGQEVKVPEKFYLPIDGPFTHINVDARISS